MVRPQLAEPGLAPVPKGAHLSRDPMRQPGTGGLPRGSAEYMLSWRVVWARKREYDLAVSGRNNGSQEGSHCSGEWLDWEAASM